MLIRQRLHIKTRHALIDLQRLSGQPRRQLFEPVPGPRHRQGRAVTPEGQPAPGLTVRLKGTSIGTTTTADGQFLLEGPAGSSTLLVTGIGYPTVEREIDIIAGQTIVSELEMPEQLAQLQSVEILGRKETDYKNAQSFIGSKSATLLKDLPQSVAYVTKELMLDQAAFRVNDIVKNMSGVGQFSFYNDLTIRGCPPDRSPDCFRVTNCSMPHCTTGSRKYRFNSILTTYSTEHTGSAVLTICVLFPVPRATCWPP